jgi:hypothetical protein
MIVTVLGCAAILWTTASFGWLDLSNQFRMQKRTMRETGATTLPQTQLKVMVKNDGCFVIDGAFANGKTVHFYAKNKCSTLLTLPNYAYNVETTDGTTIESGQYAFSGNVRIDVNERREEIFDIKDDNRATSILICVIH